MDKSIAQVRGDDFEEHSVSKRLIPLFDAEVLDVAAIPANEGLFYTAVFSSDVLFSFN